MAAKRSMRGPRRRGPRERGPWASLGAVVSGRRHELGLPQSELAALADVALTTIQALEAGRAAARIDSLNRVLDALGLALVVMPAARVSDVSGATVLTSERGEADASEEPS